MDIRESRLYTNWTIIIRELGSTRTIDFRKDGRIMTRTTKPEWRNTLLINILRRQEDGDKISAKHPLMFDLEGRKESMNKRVGLWLDRKQAVIVSIANNVEARAIITSDMEHYVLYSTVVPGDGSPEEIRDRRFWKHLGEYYDKIIGHLRDAVEIQIFGPEEAKYELQKRLEDAGLAEQIVSVEDAGTLTNLEISAKVKERFPIRSQFDIF